MRLYADMMDGRVGSFLYLLYYRALVAVLPPDFWLGKVGGWAHRQKTGFTFG